MNLNKRGSLPTLEVDIACWTSSQIATIKSYAENIFFECNEQNRSKNLSSMSSHNIQSVTMPQENESSCIFISSHRIAISAIFLGYEAATLNRRWLSISELVLPHEWTKDSVHPCGCEGARVCVRGALKDTPRRVVRGTSLVLGEGSGNFPSFKENSGGRGEGPSPWKNWKI